jgi:hypothetical protein
LLFEKQMQAGTASNEMNKKHKKTLEKQKNRGEKAVKRGQ